MLALLRLFLLAGILLAAVPARGVDTLPQLPASGSQGLPTLGSVNMSNQSISVTCYLGNPNDNQSLGSITVNGPAAAGATCNSFNYSCQGRCFGCYSDFDMSEDVCVDAAGRRFLR